MQKLSCLPLGCRSWRCSCVIVSEGPIKFRRGDSSWCCHIQCQQGLIHLLSLQLTCPLPLRHRLLDELLHCLQANSLTRIVGLLRSSHLLWLHSHDPFLLLCICIGRSESKFAVEMCWLYWTTNEPTANCSHDPKPTDDNHQQLIVESSNLSTETSNEASTSTNTAKVASKLSTNDLITAKHDGCNTTLYLSQSKMDELSVCRGENLVVMSKAEHTFFAWVVLVDTESSNEDINIVRLAVVCVDIEYASEICIKPRWSSDVEDDYIDKFIKPYFEDQYCPVTVGSNIIIHITKMLNQQERGIVRSGNAENYLSLSIWILKATYCFFINYSVFHQKPITGYTSQSLLLYNQSSLILVWTVHYVIWLVYKWVP